MLEDGDGVIGCCLSEIHGKPGLYECLLGTSDGREVGVLVDSAAIARMADEFGQAVKDYAKPNMTFSDALKLIKDGHRLRRAGWNGKGMFVFLVGGSNFKVNREPLLSILGEGADVTYRPHIDISHPDGTVSVWQPSMGDVLAHDWEIVPL